MFQGHGFYIAKVIELAKQNVEKGGRPFACLIVHSTTGEILAEAANEVAQTGDPSAHAEISAIRKASQILREKNKPVDGSNGLVGEDMKGYIFYILPDPCSMCASAMAYCGADLIVHAITRAEYTKYYRDDRRQVDMDTFSEASKVLLAKQSVVYHPDPSAIEVYKLWQTKNAH